MAYVTPSRVRPLSEFAVTALDRSSVRFKTSRKLTYWNGRIRGEDQKCAKENEPTAWREGQRNGRIPSHCHKPAWHLCLRGGCNLPYIWDETPKDQWTGEHYTGVMLILCSSTAAPEDPEAILQERRTGWRINTEPKYILSRYMKETRQARIHWIHGDSQPLVSEILQAYPHYTDPDGFVWVGLIEYVCRYTALFGLRTRWCNLRLVRWYTTFITDWWRFQGIIWREFCCFHLQVEEYCSPSYWQTEAWLQRCYGQGHPPAALLTTAHTRDGWCRPCRYGGWLLSITGWEDAIILQRLFIQWLSDMEANAKYIKALFVLLYTYSWTT